MYKSLLKCLQHGDKAQLLCWGRHEGIRGASWLQVHADGRLIEQHYVPNADGVVSTKLLGRLPSERFDDLVKQVASIPDDDLRRDPGAIDPVKLVTLECICAHTTWQWSISPADIAESEKLSSIAAAFFELVQELPKQSDGA